MLLLGEHLTATTLAGTVILLGAVAALAWQEAVAGRTAPMEREPEPEPELEPEPEPVSGLVSGAAPVPTTPAG